MPTKQFLISGTRDDPSNAATEYSALLGNGNELWDNTEAPRESIIPTAGKLSNFQVGIGVAPGAGLSWTFTIRKSAYGAVRADTTLSVVISNSSVLSSLDTDEVTVTAGDRVTIKAVPTGTPTACAAVYWTCQFTPNTDGETILLSNNAGAGVTADSFNTLIGGKSPDATEFNAQTLFPTAGTLKKFYVELGTAPGVDNSRIFTIRVNGGATNLVVTMSGTPETGNNTANTVTIAAGDKVTIQNTVTGTPAASTSVKFGIVFLPDVQGEYIASATTDNVTNSTAVEYQHLNCGDSLLTATESEQHGLAQATTAKKIYVNLSTAPGNGYSWIFTLREALGNTALTVTISNAATSGNAAIDEAVAADALVDTLIDATAGAATSKSQIAYLFYNAPTEAGVTVTPGVIAQTTTKYIPVLQLKIIGASPTAQTLTKFNAVTGYGYVPSTLAQTTTKYASVLKFGIIPSTKSLTVTKYIPVLKFGIIPSTLSQTITKYNAVFGLGVVPTTLGLADTQYIPVLKFGIIPSTLSLVDTHYAPIIIVGLTVTPSVLVLSDTEYASVLKYGIIVGTLSLSDTEFVPTIIIAPAYQYLGMLKLRDGFKFVQRRQTKL